MVLIKFLAMTLFFMMEQQCDSATSFNILTIGDSNGASPVGWVYQLSVLRSNDKFFNCSIGGNTIGFDNLGKDTLNTLKNIHKYLKNAEDSLIRLDKILILLGTNDCKSVFDSIQVQVPENLDKLIRLIKNYPFKSESIPEIVLITPPPIAQDSVLQPKYHGGLKRLEKLLPSYQEIAERYECRYVDLFHPLASDFDSYTEDGIHLNEPGYRKSAEIINRRLN